MAPLRSLESYLSDNLLSLTGNELSFALGADLVKVHESISENYESDNPENNPISSVTLSRLRISEILNASFVKFLFESILLRMGNLLTDKDLLDKKSQKAYEEYKKTLELPSDILEILVNYSLEKEKTILSSYNTRGITDIDFSLTSELFKYIGLHQETLSEDDENKLTPEHFTVLTKDVFSPLMKIFGLLFDLSVRPKIKGDKGWYPYVLGTTLGRGSAGDSFSEGIHKKVLEMNSVSDYKEIPVIQYSKDAINIGYSILESDIFNHYKNAMQSFFLIPFISHTINVNLHLPSPILPEGLLKEGGNLRREIAAISNELMQEMYSKKVSKSFKNILVKRAKILNYTSQIPISGIVQVSKERKLTELYPQIKSKHFPKSKVLKRAGIIREFKLQTLEEPLTIFGEQKENVLHIKDIPSILKLISYFSLSGKGIHGAEVEDNRIKPRIKFIHKTQIK